MINTDEEEKGYRETDALLLGRRTIMYEGSTAVLKILHVYLEGELMDESEYVCRITAYDPDQEYMYMTVEEGDLTSISLDAEYDCSIRPEDVSCQGTVKERYFDREGSRLIFSVENGFYKNNIN